VATAVVELPSFHARRSLTVVDETTRWRERERARVAITAIYTKITKSERKA
jgi:hypothetical protein